ncbi:MAG: hypothetical protein U0168_25470 [Nannocystaceae bacterium]
MSGSTHRRRYTEDGLLQRIERESAAGTNERVYEASAFDHRRRPLAVEQGDAVRTSFAYDVVTERLLRLQTGAGGRVLQDLQYVYDAMGNITQVRDGAQAVLYRDNAEVSACNDYRYDALYRLVEASGREHEGQAANGRTPRASDAVVVPLRAGSPSDRRSMRRDVRKLVMSGEGVIEDRVYLGAQELYTKRRGATIVEKTLTEHAGGGLQVDIKLIAQGKTIAQPVALRRYAVADHLGSSKLEVDPAGEVIAYEEFHPYGSSSYRAMRTGLAPCSSPCRRWRGVL